MAVTFGGNHHWQDEVTKTQAAKDGQRLCTTSRALTSTSWNTNQRFLDTFSASFEKYPPQHLVRFPNLGRVSWKMELLWSERALWPAANKTHRYNIRFNFLSQQRFRKLKQKTNLSCTCLFAGTGQTGKIASWLVAKGEMCAEQSTEEVNKCLTAEKGLLFALFWSVVSLKAASLLLWEGSAWHALIASSRLGQVERRVNIMDAVVRFEQQRRKETTLSITLWSAHVRAAGMWKAKSGLVVVLVCIRLEKEGERRERNQRRAGRWNFLTLPDFSGTETVIKGRDGEWEAEAVKRRSGSKRWVW